MLQDVPIKSLKAPQTLDHIQYPDIVFEEARNHGEPEVVFPLCNDAQDYFPSTSMKRLSDCKWSQPAMQHSEPPVSPGSSIILHSGMVIR